MAKTQSQLLLHQLEKRTDHKFELCFIKTKGDQIVDKPLWQLDGKDFFTRELDQALLEQKVDLVIHSYKDLGSERPEGIQLGAITQRTFAHDVLLFKKNDQIKDIFQVATSSPRRQVNLKASLSDFLPGSPSIEIKNLRGNVNTRIEKLLSGHADGIVLALAGLERLAQGEESSQTLKQLLGQLNFMVLPQSHFPSAASQGALAIEYSSHHPHVQTIRSILKTLDHPLTRQEVEIERRAFQTYGGGCHLAVGLNCQQHDDFMLEIHRGEVDGKKININRCVNDKKIPRYKSLFIGLPQNKIVSNSQSAVIYDEWLIKEKKQLHLPSSSHLFVTSPYVLHCFDQFSVQEGQWIATSGASTWKHMAQKGFLVQMTSDSMGEASLLPLTQSKALGFMSQNLDWKVLSHDKSTSLLGERLSCYTKHWKAPTPNEVKALTQVEACYWGSFSQFKTYCEKIPTLAHKDHYCGVGKTRQQFKDQNIPVTPLFSYRDLIQGERCEP